MSTVTSFSLLASSVRTMLREREGEGGVCGVDDAVARVCDVDDDGVVDRGALVVGVGEDE